jgi:hypothetical protein
MSDPLGPRQDPLEPLHRRSLELNGFRRGDGRYVIEGRLTDMREDGFANPWRGELAPGEQLHAMQARVVIDADLMICELALDSQAHPYPGVCGQAPGAYAGLIGQSMAGGFRKRLTAAVGRASGCTHLTDLLLAMATVAYQTSFWIKNACATSPARDQPSAPPSSIPASRWRPMAR